MRVIVTTMNHIVTTHVLTVATQDEADDITPEEVVELAGDTEPDHEDCTMSEVVESYPAVCIVCSKPLGDEDEYVFYSGGTVRHAKNCREDKSNA